MIDHSLLRPHLRIAGELLHDQPLCRWVLARHARARGNRFFHLELEPS